MVQPEGPVAATPAIGTEPSFTQSVTAYFRLWRYDSNGVVLCFISMYLGWIALADGFADLSVAAIARIAAAAAAATCILLAVFMINDAVDREIDKTVHPERPIPQGASAWQHIYGLGAGLLVVGIMLALTVNTRFALVTTLLAAFVTLHYGYLKRRLRIPCSSEIITPMMSALFPLSAFAVMPEPRVDLLLAVVAFIYFADLAQDILGGVHDQEGDRQHGVRTFALAVGAGPALWISVGCFLIAVVAGWLVYDLGQLGWLYLLAYVVLTAVMAYHYVQLFRASPATLHEAAGKANHIGGFYFFIISGSLFPDFLLRQLIG
jgi:geranylgeranylglycerol-phosphate geranylgeranyltransferase